MADKLDTLRRIFTRTTVHPETCCLLYEGSTSGEGRGGGYGRCSHGGQTVAVHILSFQAYRRRAVKPGFFLDHLCENRNCWNPHHLEEVKQSVNEKRKRRRRKRAPATVEGLMEWLALPVIASSPSFLDGQLSGTNRSYEDMLP